MLEFVDEECYWPDRAVVDKPLSFQLVYINPDEEECEAAVGLSYLGSDWLVFGEGKIGPGEKGTVIPKDKTTMQDIFKIWEVEPTLPQTVEFKFSLGKVLEIVDEEVKKTSEDDWAFYSTYVEKAATWWDRVKKYAVPATVGAGALTMVGITISALRRRR